MEGFSLKPKPQSNRPKPVVNAFGQPEDNDANEHSVRVVTELSSDSQKPQEKKELLIPVQPNKNWRQVAKNKTLFAPGRNSKEVVEEPTEKVQYGLNVLEKNNDQQQTPPQKQKLEEKSQSTTESLYKLKQKDMAEEELPEAPGVESYNRVPVEEFGAALLRGMGWKGNDNDKDTKDNTKGSSDSEVRRRPAFLGLGAKPIDNGSLESEAWGKGVKRPEKSYVPLVKKDLETGEITREGPSSDRGSRGNRSRSRSRSPTRVPVGKWSRMEYRGSHKDGHKEGHENGYRHRDDYSRRKKRDHRHSSSGSIRSHHSSSSSSRSRPY